MVIKLFGLGFKEYAKDSFNLFDAVVVALSLIELVLVSAGVQELKSLLEEPSPLSGLSDF
jgi:hypothetical protein